VMAIVLARLQRCTRDVRTNGNQCVGMAAWKNAIPNPVIAIVVRTAWFTRARRSFEAVIGYRFQAK
jgi:hypothetical protein